MIKRAHRKCGDIGAGAMCHLLQFSLIVTRFISLVFSTIYFFHWSLIVFLCLCLRFSGKESLCVSYKRVCLSIQVAKYAYTHYFQLFKKLLFSIFKKRSGLFILGQYTPTANWQCWSSLAAIILSLGSYSKWSLSSIVWPSTLYHDSLLWDSLPPQQDQAKN